MVKTTKTVEVFGTITLDFSQKFKVTSQEDLDNKLAMLSSLGIVDVSTLVMHTDGSVTQPRVHNVEVEVEHIEDEEEGC